MLGKIVGIEENILHLSLNIKLDEMENIFECCEFPKLAQEEIFSR